MKKIEKSDTSLIQAYEETLCRICLNASTDLLSPCKCSGSIQYVHEECLKTWILAKQSNLSEAQCELCMNKYTMEYELSMACNCYEMVYHHFSRCLVGPLLLSIEGMVILMIMLLIESLKEDGSIRATVLIGILIFICSVAAIVLLVLTVIVIKQLCIVKKLTKWKILSYVSSRDNLDESTVILQAPPVLGEPEVLVIPPTINVGGVSVLTPRLNNLQRNDRGSYSARFRDIPSELNHTLSENRPLRIRERSDLSLN